MKWITTVRTFYLEMSSNFWWDSFLDFGCSIGADKEPIKRLIFLCMHAHNQPGTTSVEPGDALIFKHSPYMHEMYLHAVVELYMMNTCVWFKRPFPSCPCSPQFAFKLLKTIWAWNRPICMKASSWRPLRFFVLVATINWWRWRVSGGWKGIC